MERELDFKLNLRAFERITDGGRLRPHTEGVVTLIERNLELKQPVLYERTQEILEGIEHAKPTIGAGSEIGDIQAAFRTGRTTGFLLLPSGIRDEILSERDVDRSEFFLAKREAINAVKRSLGEEWAPLSHGEEMDEYKEELGPYSDDILDKIKDFEKTAKDPAIARYFIKGIFHTIFPFIIKASRDGTYANDPRD